MHICKNIDCKYTNLFVINSHKCSNKVVTVICQNRECDSFKEQISVWKDSHRCFKRESPNRTRQFIQAIFNELVDTENQILINKKLKEQTENQLDGLEKLKDKLLLEISAL